MRLGKREPIPYEGDKNKEAIVQELKIHAGLAERPKRKSQALPSSPKENGLYVLVGDNFEEIIDDEWKYVLVLFYAPWCKHS